MDSITAAILFVLSAFVTFASIRFNRKSRNKSSALLPALFGALTVIIGLFLVLKLLGYQG
ncbi:MAG: hypothetical protein AAGU74_07955 [Bacillota bacterium]